MLFQLTLSASADLPELFTSHGMYVQHVAQYLLGTNSKYSFMRGEDPGRSAPGFIPSSLSLPLSYLVKLVDRPVSMRRCAIKMETPGIHVSGRSRWES